MIAVRLSEVPLYLQCGEFYKSLDLSTDDEITVPKDVMKSDFNMKDCSDVMELFQSIRFWGVSEIPFEVIDSLLESSNLFIDEEYDEAFPVLPVIRQLQLVEDKLLRVHSVVEAGCVFLLKYLVERGAVIDTCICRLAFDLGHIDCLKYLHQNNFLVDLKGISVAMNCATQNRIAVPNLPTLEYALHCGCLMDSILMDSAAQAGMLDVMMYAFDHGVLFTPATPLHIVAHGHLECLRWYHETGGEWSITVTIMAASNGALDCLQYACEQGCAYDAHTALRAAYNNQLPCLQYLHSIGCPWDENVALYAALRGNLQCLQYAHECGCPVGCRAYAVAKLHEHLNCVHYLESNSIH